MVSVTSARPRCARPDVPAKMTSSILPPRKAFAPCSPSTQAIASTTLLLPEPFGPTTQVMPGSNRSVVAEAKDLNPRSVSDLRCTKLPDRFPRRPGQAARVDAENLSPRGVNSGRHAACRQWTSGRGRSSPSGSGQSGLGYLGDAVQLRLKFGVARFAQLRQLGLELGDPPAQPSDLHREDLLIVGGVPDVAQQGSCHVWRPFEVQFAAV